MTTISTLPSAPEITDTPATFNSKAFAWVAALDDFVTETNAVAGEVNGYATAADASADAAAASAVAADASADSAAATVAAAVATAQADALAAASAAAASALAAAASAGAVLWVSGTTYAVGFVVWSPITRLVYRRLIAGAGTTDPSADATNWAQVLTSGALDSTTYFYATF